MVISEGAFAKECAAARDLVDQRLGELVPKAAAQDRLNQSMRHSLLAPGKRLRPVMTVLTAEALRGEGRRALDTACAIEMVHTASLIVDDLPCMDDAALRRGRRTSHSRFGMDVALLTAIALLNRAPMVIACCPDLEEPLRLRLIQLLSLATGDDDGLAAGQMADLQALQETTSTGQLRQIVLQKTAALFVYAVESGARIAGADAETISSMRKFAENFGLAFQILDDLADAHGSADQLKKDVGQDVRKATYASALGADGAKDLAQRHTSDAMRVLDAVGLADSPLARVAIETLNPSAIESLH